jgi:hypothetical protein
VLGDEGAIRIIEVEVPRQLIGCRLACKATVAVDLLVRKEANGHKKSIVKADVLQVARFSARRQLRRLLGKLAPEVQSRAEAIPRGEREAVLQ